MNVRYYGYVLLFLAASLATPAWAQVFTCMANTGVPPLVRAEGLTELTGDIVINCSGDVLPAGSPAPLVNIQVSLNTNVTSRLLNDNLTEALLLIDEPRPENQFPATGPVETTVGCVPSPACPNAFFAARVGPNSVIWVSVPLQTGRTFRLTNIRANAAQLNGPFPDASNPVQLATTVQITPARPDVVFQPFVFTRQQDVLASINFSVENPVSFSGTAGHRGPVATLSYQENFPGAFKKKDCATSSTNPNPSREDQFRIDICRTNLLFPFLAQNAGFETGLVIANTSQDPFYDRAGVSRGGTELLAYFGNIPTGMRNFVSATNADAGPGRYARLLQAPDSNEFATPQPNNFVPMLTLCPDYQSTRSCAVAWRILETNPDTTETFRFQIDGISDPGNAFAQTNVTTVTPMRGPSAAAWDAERPVALPNFEGYTFALANFQLAHGFSFISDQDTHRLAQGYLALILPQELGRPEAEFDHAAWEARSEQLSPIRALSANRVLLLDADKQQSAPRRFELTSEGYLPKRLRLASMGQDRLRDFTITVQTSSSPSQSVGDSWLRVEKIGEATPVTLVVTAHPEGLQPGTYAGSITATPAVPPGVAPVNIPFELVVPPPGPRVRTFGVTSAGSYAHSVVAPGEAVVIFGQGFGPSELAGLTLNNGVVATEIGATRVLFDGEPAPLIYSVANQASCFVPFSVAGKKFVEMVVEYQGVASPPVRLAVLPAKPALLTSDQSGGGIGAILNEDNSFNVQKAAKPGEIIQIFGIGGGQTTPPSVGGRLQSNAAEYNLPIRVFVDGVEVESLYAAPAPGLVEGVFQVNVRLPQNLRSGQVPISIYFGEALHTQPGVTAWVQ